MKSKLIFNDTYLQYYCPGCKQKHHVRITGNTRPVWQFNNNLNRPTLTPSIKCLPYNDPETGQRLVLQCHHFITDGKIIYCSDCDHELKGQTLPLQDIE